MSHVKSASLSRQNNPRTFWKAQLNRQQRGPASFFFFKDIGLKGAKTLDNR